MSDFLVDLGANPQARKIISSLGLPIPLPRKLARGKGPWQERPLDGHLVAVGGASGAALSEPLAQALGSAGASAVVVGDALDTAAFAAAGEAWGRPPASQPMAPPDGAARPHALVLDLTGADDVAGLRALFDVIGARVRALRPDGRVVVAARPPDEAGGALAAATAAGVEGFVKSLAKEIGRKGATANAVYVETGAEDRLDAPLRFLLSVRSAYVTGQALRVSKRVRAAEARWTAPLEGKVALVTGAARGIGADTARRLAAEGAHVVVLDRPADDGPASKIAQEVGGSLLLCDVTDADAPARISSHLSEARGGVDIVVHNAGITRDKTLANMGADRWDLTLAVNLQAVAAITARLLDDGTLNSFGRVIGLSSVAGIAGNFGQTNYAASKAAVIGWVRALAPTLARRGITVNAIAPGFIETRLTAAIPPVTREVARRMSALSQGGLPVDIAEAVTFLASPGASGLTGEVLRVCGGSFVGR